jgi:hypothetical protein
MMWRVFRKARPVAPDRSTWWDEADAVAAAVTEEAIDQLARKAASAADDAEREAEMIEGLRDLLTVLETGELPTVATQHRVIGTDICHLVAPASIVDLSGAAGKLFVTSNRLVFAAGSVRAAPWHRVRGVARAGRDVLVTIAGVGEPLHLRCNTYSDALVARHMADTLRR